MPIANVLRDEGKTGSRIVSVTGLDPTLLNLSRRQGWLTSIDKLDQEKIKSFRLDGAKYVVGSLNWEESYVPLQDNKSKESFKNLICNDKNASYCPLPPHYTYIIPIENLLVETDGK